MKTEDAEEYTQALGQVVAGGWRQVALGERLGVPDALGLTTRDWVEQRLGGYLRMSIPERREAAAELEAEGMSQREIADVLGVGQATVHRDLAPDSDESSKPPEGPNSSDDEPEPEAPDSDESSGQGLPAGQDEADAILSEIDGHMGWPITENEEPEPEPEPEPQPTPEPEPEPLQPALPGWHQLGEHRLYCGSSTDPEFIEACQGAAFAFADPPYNAGKADWDEGFQWAHDYLAEQSAIVAVTPGISWGSVYETVDCDWPEVAKPGSGRAA